MNKTKSLDIESSNFKISIFENTKLHLCCIIALTLFIYKQTNSFDYAGDDVLVIGGNQYVQNGIKDIPKIFCHSYMYGYTLESDPLYRPIPLASYAIESQWFGSKPSTHHYIQVILYLLSLIICYFLLRLWQIDAILSFLITLLFSIHPLHTEVVANIKSRDEILSLLFLLGMLYMHAKHSLESSGNWRLICSIIFYFLALLCKESAVTYIGLVFLVDFFIYKKNTITAYSKNFIYFIPLLLYFLIRHSIDLGDTSKLTIMENSLLATQSYVERIPSLIFLFFKYISLFLLPHGLSYDYSFNQLALLQFSDLKFILSGLVGILLIYYIIRTIHSKEYISFGLIWFVVCISVTSNVFFLTGATFAERFAFIPILGLCISIVFFTKKILEHYPDTRKYQAVFIATIVLCMTYMSYSRTQVWKNDNELFKSGIISAPNSARTNFCYARYFINESKKTTIESKKKNLIDSSIIYYNKALSIYPKFTHAHHFLAWAYRDIGNSVAEKKSYLNALQCDSTYFPALISLGIAELKSDNYTESIAYFEKAKSISPTSYDIEYNLGLAYKANKQFSQAIQSQHNAHAINPKRAEPISQLIKIYRDDVNNIDSALYFNELIKSIK